MALSLVLEKNVLYKDGQSVGTIVFPDGKELQARVRVYPNQNNLVTIQTYFPLTGLTPRRSNWADHPKEWLIEQGVAAADVLYISTRAQFAVATGGSAAGGHWGDDERHLETPELLTNPELGDKPNLTLQFKIKDNGSVETATYTPDSTIQQQDLINKTAQEKAIAAATADELQKKNDTMWKYIKIGGAVVGVVALGFGAYALWKNYQKNKKSKGKKDNKDDLKGK